MFAMVALPTLRPFRVTSVYMGTARHVSQLKDWRWL